MLIVRLSFIQVNVTGSGTNPYLYFNLVWLDGVARNNLSLNYYDAAQNYTNYGDKYIQQQRVTGEQNLIILIMIFRLQMERIT